MPIADYTVPMLLVTPAGSLALNDPTQLEGFFAVDPANADSGVDIRSEIDNVPSAPGWILHPQFDTGYSIKLAVQLWDDPTTPACPTSDPTDQAMVDLLCKILRSTEDGGGRMIYNPTGEPQRLFDQFRLASKIALTQTAADGTVISFTLNSVFPYTFDFDQTETDFNSTATLTNDGSVSYYPVIQVAGPFSAFTLTNEDALDVDGNPLKIVYDDTLPGAVPVGGGHYIEINTFNNTVYLDGDGPSRKAGIDIVESDFFPLVLGDNVLTIASDGTFPAPEVTVLWAPAWY